MPVYSTMQIEQFRMVMALKGYAVAVEPSNSDPARWFCGICETTTDYTNVSERIMVKRNGVIFGYHGDTKDDAISKIINMWMKVDLQP